MTKSQVNHRTAIKTSFTARARRLGRSAAGHRAGRPIEVSLTTTDALAVIKQARAELGPDATVGAGTVRTVADAARAVDAGASYLVTPALVDDLRSSGVHVPVLMGALTPGEIELALARGAGAIKLFPGSLGGPSYLRALRDPFPDVPFGGGARSRLQVHRRGGRGCWRVSQPVPGGCGRPSDCDNDLSSGTGWTPQRGQGWRSMSSASAAEGS
ncbi:bifunctional 4-hydroxy-2-oxoglutarate aldolase/2-dehydro-3-deoxy-phosphogluconate aldolase [Streptomyces sp. NPDC020845]|uniref:bifunctional 4-hydroxy-2-oxoglutarate aldolase/2-dehydro-3-deoxy-phosphogluconate aldolase n=1 Tax=Streptomyces sp. NPDC020845 TaxID=3365096 RepID=UPI0037B0DD51